MSWQKRGGGEGGKYITFKAGTSVEGILKDVQFTSSPFAGQEGKTVVVITLDVHGEERILTSGSANLKQVFSRDAAEVIELGTEVKLEMISKGGKKMYNVYANE
jgi:hypothetical protein